MKRSYTFICANYPNHFIINMKYYVPGKGWFKPKSFRLKDKFRESVRDGAVGYSLIVFNQASKREVDADISLDELKSGDYSLMYKNEQDKENSLTIKN